MAPPNTPRKGKKTPAPVDHNAPTTASVEVEETPQAFDISVIDAVSPEAAPEGVVEPAPVEAPVPEAEERQEPAPVAEDVADVPRSEPEAAPAQPVDPEPELPLPPPVVAQSPSPRRGGFFALLLGGVAAAAIGFGMARYVLPEGWPAADQTALADQMSSQSAQLQAQAVEIAALRQGLQTPSPALAALEAQLATAQAEIAALTDRLAAAPAPSFETSDIEALSARLEALENRPLSAGGESVDGAVLLQLQTAFAALQNDFTAQQRDIAATAELARAELARFEAEAEAARQSAAREAEAAQQAVLAQAAAERHTAVLSHLAAALLSGVPYADLLTSLPEGAQIPATLSDQAESGVPTVIELQASFVAPARTAIAEELQAHQGDSLASRLDTFWRSHTGARSLTPQEGTHADAVLSRAQAALSAEDVALALSEVETLSPAARSEMAEWEANARAHLAALAAFAELSAAQSEERAE